MGALADLVRRGGAADASLVAGAVDACLADMDPGGLGAVVHVAAERALAEGLRPGPLSGVPVLVKDIVDVAGEVTRCGSLTTLDDEPAERDAEVVRRLRALGAVVVGRTRTHEHAWGLTTQHAVLGGTLNPVDRTRVPGGSSGGSAAAVAAGLVPLALGTDTACSLRLPAAWCGVVGHKPTHGLVPAEGISELARSLDHPGAITADVADARVALEVLSGVPHPVRRESLAGLKVGLLAGPDLPWSAEVGQVVGETADLLERGGAEVTWVHPPRWEEQWEVFVALQAAEAVAAHEARGWWPDAAASYGPDVRGRLERAARVAPQQVDAARRTREVLRGEVDLLWEGVDVLLSAVAGTGPSTVAEPDVVLLDGERRDLRECVLPWTVLQDLCGLPACALPAGVDGDGLPVGVQLTGPRDADGLVLDVAGLLEGLLGRPAV